MTNNENNNQARPVDLDALEALLEEATQGEWTASSHDWFAVRTDALIICDRPPIFYSESHAAWPGNSVAIAALHNAAPVLIGELRALRADETMHVEVIGDLMAETTKLKAEIEQLQEANRWRPIAEAPKDGTPFEALHRDSGFIRVVGLSELGTFDVFYPLDYFTHYRPIPNLPEGA